MYKKTRNEFYGDLLQLRQHIKEHHTDEYCAKWITMFDKKYYNKLTKDFTKIEKRKTRSDTKADLKQTLLDS